MNLDAGIVNYQSIICVDVDQQPDGFVFDIKTALIKPATKKRVDLGLKLKGIENQGCLEGSGPFGTMCTHRIQLTNVGAVNSEVKSWLLAAYNASV